MCRSLHNEEGIISMKNEKKDKVVILGAGLTGLTAAHFLENPSSGGKAIKPFILEKQDIAGGALPHGREGGFLF